MDINSDHQGSIYTDGTYLEKNPTWHSEDSRWKANQIRKLLKKHEIYPSVICEVGCGAGAILECLADDLGDRVQLFGYEISPQAFKICESKARPDLWFFYKDFLEEEHDPFDVVMAIDVFEHIEDYFGFLRKLRTKGEYKIFHIPLDMSVQWVLRNNPLLKQRSVVGHIHYFSKDTALAALRETGYEIVDHCYTRGILELPNRGWKANLLNLPRRALFAIHQDLAARVLGGFSLLVLAR